MSITWKELATAATSKVYTRDFRHLLPVPRYLIRAPRLPGQTAPKDTKPKDRIKFWNIVPGDFVRLRGDTSGSVHEVQKVNKLSNRVILKREDNKQVRANEAPQFTGKSVPYSSCQLLVGKYEYPPENGSTEPKIQNVFASRMTTSEPFFDRRKGHWCWKRYAVNTVPRLPNYSPETHVSIRIDWPTKVEPKKPEPSAYDTTEDVVNEVTYTPPPLPTSLLSPVPRTPTAQEYITSLRRSEEATIAPSAPVEVHLAAELSNPHSRAKKQARWQAANARKKQLLEETIAAEYANLDGRTKSVARAEATFKWQQQLETERRAELVRRWRNRGAEARLERRRARKVRKLAKRDAKLRTLVLEEAPNQVLPESQRRSPRSA